MIKSILLSATLLALTGCQSAYYSTMEKVGYHKRDILVDRVENAQDSQKDAQEQFKSALEQFQSIVAFDGGELEKVYNQLNDEYEASLEAAENVTNRIEKVNDVAEALFEEWQDELEQYSNTRLKQQSATQLRETRAQYDKLIRSMRKAESKMQPFLTSFKDNVLFLKHNLNASAIGALKGELVNIQKNVDNLVQEMERSIKESDKFIESLKKS
ncbi:DUF2959 domain-containing protein [Catenovulum sp. 2E275]|uniref:DUF2959 domain-containing protein n=1 Tax=Catenovulum sp. 2E275 TaxID=2980497 RepID=UPI0021D2F7C7|nr:DUF2959 domain-containing protein [Catenovulum sp. 2E275]MCU4675529.1 DUF2959 domain-containing protein [Catenovulum sp. 2E275]